MPERPDPEARSGAAPWIAAAVAAAVLAALVVLYFVALRPKRDDVVSGQLTSREQAAMSMAGQEAANLLTLRRSHFDADFARAVDGATGSLRKSVSAEKSTTLKTLNQGKFDLNATVTHVALVGPVTKGSERGYTVLVTLNGYKSSAPDVPTQQNLQATVVLERGKWLLDDVTSVGIS